MIAAPSPEKEVRIEKWTRFRGAQWGILLLASLPMRLSVLIFSRSCVFSIDPRSEPVGWVRSLGACVPPVPEDLLVSLSAPCPCRPSNEATNERCLLATSFVPRLRNGYGRHIVAQKEQPVHLSAALHRNSVPGGQVLRDVVCVCVRHVLDRCGRTKNASLFLPFHSLYFILFSLLSQPVAPAGKD